MGALDASGSLHLERYQCMWNAGDDVDEEVTSQRLAKLRVMRREAVAR